ncbi:hypothetical protein FQA39_LY15563 [Lamprigera yunnana]|nr:hypothetical protein FQA39_LY15563 [Lamprigera yunnana]
MFYNSVIPFQSEKMKKSASSPTLPKFNESTVLDNIETCICCRIISILHHCEDDSSRIECNTSLIILEQLLPSAESKAKALENIIGNSRSKRSWLPPLGAVFRTIISTLDEDDANYFKEAIEKLSKKEKETLNLLRSQTQL